MTGRQGLEGLGWALRGRLFRRRRRCPGGIRHVIRVRHRAPLLLPV